MNMQRAPIIFLSVAVGILIATYGLVQSVGPVTDHTGFDEVGLRNLWRNLVKLVIWGTGVCTSAFLLFFAASSWGRDRVKAAGQEQGLTPEQSTPRGPGAGQLMLMALGLGFASLTLFHAYLTALGLTVSFVLGLLAVVRATVSIVAPRTLLEVTKEGPGEPGLEPET